MKPSIHIFNIAGDSPTLEQKLNAIITYLDDKYNSRHRVPRKHQLSDKERVFEILNKHKILSHTDLLRHAWRIGTADVITELAFQLSCDGKIKSFRNGKGNAYQVIEAET
jgi:hypothetical protein